MTRNYHTGEMEITAADMTDSQVLRYRRWPAHLTISQMRGQIGWWQSPAFRLRTTCF